MTQLPCPACGGTVRFQSRISVFAVCPYCAQMLVRRDLDIEAIGKMALLQDEMTPLQVGPGGFFEGRRFTLLGRIKQQWSGGNWNEWYALFDDGRIGWLAEAQGFLMMSFDISGSGAALPPRHPLQPGQAIKLENAAYKVDDIKEVMCAGSEGELPFRAPKGRHSTSVDLTGAGETFACLEYSEEGTRAFAGKYVEFESLKLQNLRALDGW
jgi:hypothetical protein